MVGNIHSEVLGFRNRPAVWNFFGDYVLLQFLQSYGRCLVFFVNNLGWTGGQCLSGPEDPKAVLWLENPHALPLRLEHLVSTWIPHPDLPTGTPPIVRIVALGENGHILSEAGFSAGTFQGYFLLTPR